MGTVTKFQRQSTEEIVQSINAALAKLDEATVKLDQERIKIGKMFLDLRKRIEEEETVPWWTWYRTANINRTRKDAEKIMAQARSENPEAAAKKAKETAKKGMRATRAKKAKEQPKVTANVSGDSSENKSEPQPEAETTSDVPWDDKPEEPRAAATPVQMSRKKKQKPEAKDFDTWNDLFQRSFKTIASFKQWWIENEQSLSYDDREKILSNVRAVVDELNSLTQRVDKAA